MKDYINELRNVRVADDDREVRLKGLENIHGVVYIREREVQGNTRYLAKAYTRGSRKPKFNYMFTTSEKRKEHITKFADSLRKHENEKKADRAKTANHTLQVGDILASSWGYDQTNVNFFQITTLKGKTQCVVKEIASQRVTGSTVIPVIDSFLANGDEKVCKINTRYGSTSLKISSCQTAYVLDYELVGGKKMFKPKYETPFGMGH